MVFRSRSHSDQGQRIEAAGKTRLASMARSNSIHRTSPRGISSYIPPAPLQELHILDYLELAGSQAKAGAALAVHQSTVCRTLHLMQEQFRLETRQDASVCRHGHNPCLHYLRLAYREHRFMEGMLRIGTDVLHQNLLIRMAGVQWVPACFRSGDHWAELVRQGLLDGAIVSSFSLQQRVLPHCEHQWHGLKALPLGQLALKLVANSDETRTVLLPRKGTSPLLHRTLTAHGYGAAHQPNACQEPSAWIKRAKDRNLALPINPSLVGIQWMEMNGLKVLAGHPPLIEQLWLLLPQGGESTRAAQQCLRRLHLRVGRLKNSEWS
jgi:hypothetical protein